jgi:hypothetical protein
MITENAGQEKVTVYGCLRPESDSWKIRCGTLSREFPPRLTVEVYSFRLKENRHVWKSEGIGIAGARGAEEWKTQTNRQLQHRADNHAGARAAARHGSLRAN